MISIYQQVLNRFVRSNLSQNCVLARQVEPPIVGQAEDSETSLRHIEAKRFRLTRVIYPSVRQDASESRVGRRIEQLTLLDISEAEGF